MRFCNRCKTDKPKTDFYKRTGVASGLQSKCKTCQAEIYAIRRESGRAAEYREINKEKNKAASRKTYEARKNCPEELKRRRAYYLANRERILKKRKTDQAKINEQVQKRIKADPVLGLCKALKSRLSHSARTMHQKVTCGKALRADREKLRQRIEFNFKPGMNWQNYGEWHIDHVKPLAAFVVQQKDINLANLLCNLKPEWDADNKRKSANFKGTNYRIPFRGKSEQNTPQSTEGQS